MRDLREKLIKVLMEEQTTDALDLAMFLSKVLESREQYKEVKAVLNKDLQKKKVLRRI